MPARMQPDRGGIRDMEWLAHLNAVGAALIHYTPKHFNSIECTVRLRLEGNRLFYQIGRPDFPDEGTTEPGRNVHQAMWDRTLASKKLLGSAATKVMFTPLREEYACGIVVRKRFGRTVQTTAAASRRLWGR
jgi:hypothetical protein